MTYLLDVNALVALGLMQHEFHDRVTLWVKRESAASLATCPITELGFVRVLAQAPACGFTVAQGRALLLRMKQARNSRFTFVADAQDIAHLPGWVRAPKQITASHLARLATASGATLATLDESIPGSYVIPK
jgi:hypothetical protein